MDQPTNTAIHRAMLTPSYDMVPYPVPALPQCSIVNFQWWQPSTLLALSQQAPRGDPSQCSMPHLERCMGLPQLVVVAPDPCDSSRPCFKSNMDPPPVSVQTMPL